MVELKKEYILKILDCQNNIPIEIVSLANSLGIEVYKAFNMDADTSGAIINKNEKYVIYTNANEPVYRRRFTVAHEIAHYMLHKDIIDNHLDGNLTDAIGIGGIMYRSKLSSIFEKDANKLAAEILMPLEKIKELYLKYNDIRKLSEEFDVSEQAIKIRINNPYNQFIL